jgi:hypothetical protein
LSINDLRNPNIVSKPAVMKYRLVAVLSLWTTVGYSREPVYDSLRIQPVALIAGLIVDKLTGTKAYPNKNAQPSLALERR